MQPKVDYDAARRAPVARFVSGKVLAKATARYAVTHEQKQDVTRGLSADQVRQLIGSPISSEQGGDERGPTWTYDVVSASSALPNPHVVFDVEFDGDGRVALTNERVVIGSAGD